MTGTVITALPLRDYQRLAAEHVAAAIGRGDSRLYLELPTGTGKTRILGELARQARAEGGRVIAVAHTREIVGQLAAGLAAGTGETVGVVMASANEPGAGIVTGSVQTLVGGRLDQVLAGGPVGLLLLDEAHHAHPGNAYGHLVDAVAATNSGMAAVGCTATPYRTDRHRMSDLLPVCAFARSIPEMAAAGYLAPLAGERISFDDLDLAAVPTSQREGEVDYRPAALGEAMAAFVDGTVARSVPLFGDRQTVVFASSVEHAHLLAAGYCAAGLAAETITGTTAAVQRAALLAAWRAGVVQVVVMVAVLGEGFDLPALSAAVMAAPTQSPGRYVQCLGRVTRVAPGKADALVIDVTGGSRSLDARQVTLPILLGEASCNGESSGRDQTLGPRVRRLLDPVGLSEIAWGTDPPSGALYAAAGDGRRSAVARRQRVRPVRPGPGRASWRYQAIGAPSNPVAGRGGRRRGGTVPHGPVARVRR